MPTWKRSFWAICAAELLALAGFNTSIPILPFYLQEELGVADPVALNLWVGACATVASVTLMVFAPIWGRLADTRGKRLMLLRATIGGVVVLGLMAIVRQPWQLFVLRGMQGVLTGTVAAATVLVADIAPREEAGWALGLLATGVYVGQSVGPAIGGVLSDHLGNRVNFLFSAVELAGAAVIILRLVPPDARRAKPPGPFWRHVLPDFRALAGNRELAALLVVIGVVNAATSVASPILPLFIKQLSPSEELVGSRTGLILGLSSLAAALAAAGVGRASARIGYERSLHFLLAGAFLLAAPQGLVSTTWQLLALRVVGALFLGATTPAVNSLIALRADRAHQGTVYGLSSAINSAGYAAGPMVGASIAAGLGYPPVFHVTAAVLLATTGAAHLMVRARKEPLAAPPAR